MIQVSVIIPVYNTAAHLEKCLDSVAGQTLSDIEVICVDDGSTDESRAILACYAASDSRFYVATQENAGPGAARNAGLALASGEFIIFLDSDDWFEPQFLEHMVRRARESGADVTICRAVEFDTETGRELPSEWMLKEWYLPAAAFPPKAVAQHLFQFTYGMAWDKLYRQDFLQREGLRFPPLRNSEDLAFVFPTLLAADKIAVWDKTLIHHRVNRPASVSNTRSSQPDAPYKAFSIVKDYLETHDLMKQYQRSFLNWAMEFLVWHVSNMGDRDIQREYFRILRQDWFPRCGFQQYPISYYESKSNYTKYLLAKYLPFPLFRFIVSNYKAAKMALRGNKSAVGGKV